MKLILTILDGLSEAGIKELNYMTPLEYAYTPIIDRIKDEGRHEKRIFYPTGRQPDSLSCILSILGVDKDKIPNNRAYLEAVAAGIDIEENEAVFRCNLISADKNTMDSFNGKGLSNRKMDEVSENLKTADGIKFYHLRDYRNILVLEKNKELLSLKTVPPHENVGMRIDELFKEFKTVKILNDFIVDNQIFINGRRYLFYPWGLSEKVNLPSFFSIHKKTCSMVCGAEIVKGMAKLMNIDLPVLRNATGDADTDLKEKAETVLKEIRTHDVVVAHINGTDELSHRKDIQGKVDFIEKIDREFLSEIYANADDAKLAVLSDHRTSSVTGRHEKGFVDYITNCREE
ncbi:MAG TPA: hypothetical protein DCM73_09200 [Clostridiales bacterium]|nr:hypothetical protein [Clostridiales bacterium]